MRRFRKNSLLDSLTQNGVYLLLLGFSFLTTACSEGRGLFGTGAPTKNADDVAHIFSDAMDLSEKAGTLCTSLQQRSQEPNLNGVGLANDICTEAGTSPQNYDSLSTSLAFTKVESTTSSTDSQIFSITTRSEVWLNRNLLQLASTLIGQLEDETSGILGGGGQGSSKNQDFTFEIIGKPEFDKSNFSFSLDFNLVSTRAQNGQIDLNNSFHVEGQMFEEKYFAVTAVTTGAQPVETSLMSEGKFLILIIPHAGDVFLDISTTLLIHSFGVNATMEESLVKALGPGLKSIPDLIAKLESNQ